MKNEIRVMNLKNASSLNKMLSLFIIFFMLVLVSNQIFAQECGDGSGSDCDTTCYVSVNLHEGYSSETSPSGTNFTSIHSSTSGSCSDTSAYSFTFDLDDQETNWDNRLCYGFSDSAYFYAYGIEDDYDSTDYQFLFNTSEVSCNDALNITFRNSTSHVTQNGKVTVYEAGTSTILGWGNTTETGQVVFGLNSTKIYDFKIETDEYQQNIWFRNARVPDTIDVSENKKWVPESTTAANKKFTAGHIVPTEMHILAPYGKYPIENISIDNPLPANITFAGNVVVEKHTSSGTSTCDKIPDSSTSFLIDKTDCAFLSSLNVTDHEWLRVHYRIKLAGPEAYSSVGEEKNYTLNAAVLRFDVPI